MQQIRIYFCDFWEEHTFENDFFISILKDNYDFILDDKNPDFVICSCYGNEYKKYSCPRIFYSGENIAPDFNTYDYAISFDYIDFKQRYLRVPIYHFLQKLRKKQELPQMPQNRGFCSFVYSNYFFADKIRVDFFKLLSKYKKVNSSGGLLNNTGFKVKDKIKYLNKFKFTIAFENSSNEGYITEKITDAFCAGTIPIYWGDPLAIKEFNPEAFVFVNDFKSLDDVLKKVIEIDNDSDLYLKMLNAPKVLEPKNYDEQIIAFFGNIFASKGKILRKDINKGWDKNGNFYLGSKFKRGPLKKIQNLFFCK